MDEAFYALVDAGEHIRSVTDAHQFLEKLAEHYDVRNLAYLGVNLPGPDEVRPVFVISTYSKAWVDRYRARNYQRIDPVLPGSMKNSSARLAQSAAVASCRHPLLRRGPRLRRAETEPARFPCPAPRATWPSSRSHRPRRPRMGRFQAKEYSRVPADRFLLSSASPWRSRFQESPPAFRQLSQRERDMLWWTAEGKTTKEIALILGLT